MTLHLEETELELTDLIFVFDEANPMFHENAEYNLLFLNTIQNYYNDVLAIKGFVFLNDILVQLGFERTRAGQLVGWILNNTSRNFINFGIEHIGGTDAFKLTFNTEEVILDKFS